MNQSDTPVSPRKRIKFEHDSSHEFNLSVAPSTDKMEVDDALTPSAATTEQSEKERSCGITEFVCPDTVGFSAIVKKR